MAPTIHLVRHAQGLHNLHPDNEKLHDPDLTLLGTQQCANLRALFPHQDKLTHLLASPMRRAIYTCIRAFGAGDGNSQSTGRYTVIALDTLQEVSNAACDIGSTVNQLLAEFDPDVVDLSNVRDTWIDKSEASIFEPILPKLAARAKLARRAIRELAKNGEGHIVVVSHGAFLQFLTEEWHGLIPTYATSWMNCEYRSYQFIDETGRDENATLRETDASWYRRYGTAQRPTAAQLQECRSAMEREYAPYFKVRHE